MFEATFWRDKLTQYAQRSNYIATRQVFLTLVPMALLWLGYALSAPTHPWIVAPFIFFNMLFILRSFVLMHDCGHGSLFKSMGANRFFGFLFGVITGMPQFVWSKNHTYHHNTNGDWVKYRGVFNILSTDQFEELSEKGKARYWLFRQPLILVPAGFFYVLFFPRFNWIAGNITMLAKIVRPMLSLNFGEAMSVAQKWECKYWKGTKDYRHMSYNNVTLLILCFLMCRWIGTGAFLIPYIVSTSVAGSVGILLFTIQHNFEESYATDTARVNHYNAALEGTSFLVLPGVLNWFTADIAFHHVHHLSVAIPNYRLAACHKEFEHLFADVKRVYCKDLLSTFRYQLWDSATQQIVERSSLQRTA